MAISTIGTNSLASTAQIGSLTTASGSAPSYSARAWVNFNGTGTVAIRASGNVSSITDNGTGDYTVNFTTALPDVNYSVNPCPSTIIGGGSTSGIFTHEHLSAGPALTRTTSSVRMLSMNTSFASTDNFSYSVSVFR